MSNDGNKSTKRAPFTIFSSSAEGGYLDGLHTNFTGGVTTANMHTDTYGDFRNPPMQGPFTEAMVGGEQRRHVAINTGTDNNSNRPELFRIGFPSTGTLDISRTAYEELMVPTQESASMVYWTYQVTDQNDMIASASLDPTSTGGLFASYAGGSTSGISVDNVNGKVYVAYKHNNRVYRHDLDGSNKTEVFYSSGGITRITAVPSLEKFIYGQSTNYIFTASYDGTNQGLIVGSTTDWETSKYRVPYSTVTEKIYFREESTGDIHTSSIDGTSQGPLGVSDGLANKFCYDICVDDVNETLYWLIDNSSDTNVFTSSLSGDNFGIILDHNHDTPRGMSVDPYGKKIYISQAFNNDKIWSANLDGSDYAATIYPNVTYAQNPNLLGLRIPHSAVATSLAAPYYRDEFAKRPVNIRNIKTNSPGNFSQEYEVVQIAGRTLNPRHYAEYPEQYTTDYALNYGTEGKVLNNLDTQRNEGPVSPYSFYEEGFEDLHPGYVTHGDVNESYMGNYSASLEWQNGTAPYAGTESEPYGWLWRSGTTPSTATGPSSAHAGSCYVYTEASDGGANEPPMGAGHPDKYYAMSASILSSYNITSMSFWYHMYGADMGTLAISASLDGVVWAGLPFVADGVPVSELSGEQQSPNGAPFKQAVVDLSSYLDSDFILKINAKTGGDYDSDCAIDSISFATQSYFQTFSANTGTLPDYTLPDNTGSLNDFIFVNKFSAPGDRYTMSRGFLNPHGEEMSVYNANPYRNLNVREELSADLATHTPKATDIPPETNTKYHTTNRNTRYYKQDTPQSSIENMVDISGGATLLSISLDKSSGKMYWIENANQKIQRANLDGTAQEDVITTVGLPYGLAIDSGAGKVYWAETGATNKIVRANLDGSSPEDLVTAGLTYPAGIALDVESGKMYWVDNATDKVQRANLDGTSVEDLVTGLDTPLSIALDTASGKMYWSDNGTPGLIQRANLDGSSIEDIITGGVLYIRDIAIDTSLGKIYWCKYRSSPNGMILRANLDGTDIEELVTELDYPYGIALDIISGKIYWTSNGEDKIKRADMPEKPVYDDGYVTHAIPQSSLQYSWIKDSAETTISEFQGYATGSDIQFYSNSVGFESPMNNVYIDTVNATQSFDFTGSVYGYSSWKEIRGGELALSRYYRNHNILPVANVKDKVTQYIEPPVVAKNQPLDYVLAIDDTGKPFSIKSAYGSKLQRYSNEEINKLEEIVATDKNTKYAEIKPLYLKKSPLDSNNPIKRFYSLTYGETVFPKSKNAFMGKVRLRGEYTEVPGTGSHGYDRLYGTQNTMYSTTTKRDATALNSQGYVDVSLAFDPMRTDGSSSFPDFGLSSDTIGDAAAFWQFNGNLLDSSKTKANGTRVTGSAAIGAEFTYEDAPSGLLGGAITFDDSVEFVDVGTPEEWNSLIGNDAANPSTYTFAFWIKTREAQGSTFSRVLEFGSTDLAIYYKTNVSPNSLALHIDWQSNSDESKYYWGSGADLTPGQWTHVVMSWQPGGATNTYADLQEPTLYINGAPAGSSIQLNTVGAPAGNPADYEDDNTLIANRDEGDRQLLAGLKDLIVWNRLLTSDEVASLYEQYTGPRKQLNVGELNFDTDMTTAINLETTASLDFFEANYIIVDNTSSDYNERLVEQMSGKTRWYDSYDEYRENIRGHKDTSILPEFRISENMEYYFNAGGNFRIDNKDFLSLLGGTISSSADSPTDEFFNASFDEEFLKSDEMSNFKKIKEDHLGHSSTKQITLKATGVKKLLPYNGFYPDTRVIQLGNYLSESISSGIRGYKFQINAPTTPESSLERVDSAGQQALLKQILSPGVLNNSIKAGIAVDYPYFTSPQQVVTSSTDATGEVYLVPFTTASEGTASAYLEGEARIPFSSLYNLDLSFPTNERIFFVGSEPHLNKNPYALSSSYSKYLTWDGSKTPKYELAAHNFLAETVGFFLEQGKLNSFLSAPQSEFKEVVPGRKYLMDIILRDKTQSNKFVEYHGIQDVFPTYHAVTDNLGTSSYVDPGGIALLQDENPSPPMQVDIKNGWRRTAIQPAADGGFYTLYGEPAAAKAHLTHTDGNGVSTLLRTLYGTEEPTFAGVSKMSSSFGHSVSMASGSTSGLIFAIGDPTVQNTNTGVYGNNCGAMHVYRYTESDGVVVLPWAQGSVLPNTVETLTYIDNGFTAAWGDARGVGQDVRVIKGASEFWIGVINTYLSASSTGNNTSVSPQLHTYSPGDSDYDYATTILGAEIQYFSGSIEHGPRIAISETPGGTVMFGVYTNSYDNGAGDVGSRFRIRYLPAGYVQGDPIEHSTSLPFIDTDWRYGSIDAVASPTTEHNTFALTVNDTTYQGSYAVPADRIEFRSGLLTDGPEPMWLGAINRSEWANTTNQYDEEVGRWGAPVNINLKEDSYQEFYASFPEYNVETVVSDLEIVPGYPLEFKDAGRIHTLHASSSAVGFIAIAEGGKGFKEESIIYPPEQWLLDVALGWYTGLPFFGLCLDTTRHSGDFYMSGKQYTGPPLQDGWSSKPGYHDARIWSLNESEQDVSYKQHGRNFGVPINNPYDPAYVAYTPPGFYGESVATIMYSSSVGGVVSVDEILNESRVFERMDTNRDYLASPNKDSFLTTTQNKSKMSMSASLDMFAKVKQPDIQFSIGDGGNLSVADRASTSTRESTRWAISTRFESPVIDLSSSAYRDNYTSHAPGIEDNSAWGFNTSEGKYEPPQSIWTSYGQSLSSNSNRYTLELRESLYSSRTRVSSSLIDLCGFTPGTKQIGTPANNKEISEAIMVIPYATRAIKNKTVQIDKGKHFFRVGKRELNKQRKSLNETGFAIDEETISTSISEMLEAMKKYVIPPQYNFTQYDDIVPFVSYFLEFEHTLSQRELIDIWQGVMPSIAMNPETDEVEITHDIDKHNFFYNIDIPADIKFMIFKVKKKAEWNYYNVTTDSTDDTRFRFDFQGDGEVEVVPDYSYNWPYDYFSLVERAKVDVNFTLKMPKKEDEQ
jgi:hypothetical protein